MRLFLRSETESEIQPANLKLSPALAPPAAEDGSTTASGTMEYASEYGGDHGAATQDPTDFAEDELATETPKAPESAADPADNDEADQADGEDEGKSGRGTSRCYHQAETYRVPRAFKYAHVKAYVDTVLAKHQGRGGGMDGAKWINPPSGAGLILVGPGGQRLKDGNGKDIRINFVTAAQEGRRIFEEAADAEEQDNVALDPRRLESLKRYDSMSAAERDETKAWLRTMTVGDQIS